MGECNDAGDSDSGGTSYSSPGPYSDKGAPLIGLGTGILVGAAAAGPIGAIVGGLIGFLAGAAVESSS